MERDELTYIQLQAENIELRAQLEEANDTIDAIRTGQIDALVVQGDEGHQLYTLKSADQTYRVFIEKMNEGAVTINREGLILYSNSKFASMVKLPLEKVIGLPFITFVHETSGDTFNTLVGHGWENDCKEEVELINQRDNRVCCLLSCTTLELDEGIALSLILTDLSLLKKTESELKLRNEELAAAQLATEELNSQLEDTVKERTSELSISREHFKYLANNIPQMAWTTLPNGEVNYYNEQWHSYTGLNFEGALEWAWESVLHPDDLQITREKHAASLQSGEIFEVENRYKRFDGVYRWHLNRAVPLHDDAGTLVFWVGTATDIEDQKKELERKDEFIGIASHELKTPLTSLKGYLQLITAYKGDEIPLKVKQYIAKANIALGKLQRLINDLLDVSKIQAGKLDYALAPLDLTELVKACIENAEHIYPGSIFTIEDGHDFFVKGNAERLEQVIMNLLNNAVKYALADKNVIIKTEKHTDKVRVSVIDFGRGLSDDQRERIFERFYRVEDKKYMTSGLGMGLYISTDIIRHHNGTINVDSQLGKGATFYFELPLL